LARASEIVIWTVVMVGYSVDSRGYTQEMGRIGYITPAARPCKDDPTVTMWEFLHGDRWIMRQKGDSPNIRIASVPRNVLKSPKTPPSKIVAEIKIPAFQFDRTPPRERREYRRPTTVRQATARVSNSAVDRGWRIMTSSRGRPLCGAALGTPPRIRLDLTERR